MNLQIQIDVEGRRSTQIHCNFRVIANTRWQQNMALGSQQYQPTMNLTDRNVGSSLPFGTRFSKIASLQAALLALDKKSLTEATTVSQIKDLGENILAPPCGCKYNPNLPVS